MMIRDIFPSIVSLTHGDILFIHGNKQNRTTAFEKCEGACVVLQIPRSICPMSVSLEFCKEDGSFLNTVCAAYSDTTGEFDVFSASLQDFAVGLYYFRVIIESFDSTYFGYFERHGFLITQENKKADIQISLSDFQNDEKPNVYGGFIYHIFVDRFYKFGRAKYPEDAIINPDWDNGMVQYPQERGGELKNNMFFGGTLDGIREKLPYLSSLGVTVLYLSPIFESPSNHKYDTADYMKIDDMFGGDDAFSDLVLEASKYGISILLDGVFNHTGADSKYFNKFGRYRSLGAYQSKDSPFYSWYSFQDYPEKYTCWWDIPILPRIHPDQPSCREYFVGNKGVIERYAKYGILGFRLDVVDELSDDFVRAVKNTLKSENPRSMLYGEVWEDASNKIAYGKRKQYYLGSELDGVMNYPLRTGIISFILDKKTDFLSYALSEIVENAPRRIRDAQMNFLGTHDTERILTVLANHPVDGLSNTQIASLKCSQAELKIAEKRLLCAATILFTLPGIPSVFYGDESGLQGYHDPFNRMPYPWGRENLTIRRHFFLLGNLRKNCPVYKEGDFHLLTLTSELWIFARRSERDAYITVCNISEKKMTFSVDTPCLDLLTRKKSLHFSVLPLSAKVFLLDNHQPFYIEKSK